MVAESDDAEGAGDEGRGEVNVLLGLLGGHEEIQ
jgi:hypothetical protein